MKVAVGLRRVAAGKRTSGRRAAQIAVLKPTKKKRNNSPHFSTYMNIELSIEASVIT